MRRGALFVMVYHFAGYTRVVGPAAAGLLRMPYRQWAPADHLGATLWAATFMGVGYALGAAGVTLDSTNEYFRYVEWGLLAVVGLWGLYLFHSGRALILDRLNEVLAGDDDDSAPPPAHAGSRPEREAASTAPQR
jgi:membrane protein DedA with SNARE-associated domain